MNFCREGGKKKLATFPAIDFIDIGYKLSCSYLAVMILIIWLAAFEFAIYIMKWNAIRVEKEHKRRREKYWRLLEQLKKPGDGHETT